MLDQIRHAVNSNKKDWFVCLAELRCLTVIMVLGDDR